ncbi:chorion class A protein Ld2/Ld41-like [Cydia pomonella]|uniref:chorion class A protein Ld2/Ld41-like n=1 Tax=Cydia pomonella TaxID=82600 RepID=UPI002ADE5174|nr:chorion class A protein Ld2/Ld41-like [Cydia pomonella]
MLPRFAFLVLCVQTSLIQSTLSDEPCGCGQISYESSGLNLGAIEKYSSLSLIPPSLSLSAPTLNLGASALSLSAPAYGGSGTGQVGVSGDIGASGTTVVVGSVPALGSVEFKGIVPASGSVSITGQCGCGCQ